MQIADGTPRVERSIGNDKVSFTVNVPQPYSAGARELTEGEANALNQTIAENLSNNLRKKLVEGFSEGEGDARTTRPFTSEEAQTLVDEYLADYEIGVRRAGSGERQVTDPVEREARKIARQKAVEMIKAQGGKQADFDLGPIVDAIYEANRDLLMAEGKKIVKALEAARNKGSDLDLTAIDLTGAKKDSGEPAADEAEVTEDEVQPAE